MYEEPLTHSQRNRSGSWAIGTVLLWSWANAGAHVQMSLGPTSFGKAVFAEREVAVVIEPQLAAVAAVDAQRPRVLCFGPVDLRCVPPARRCSEWLPAPLAALWTQSAGRRLHPHANLRYILVIGRCVTNDARQTIQ